MTASQVVQNGGQTATTVADNSVVYLAFASSSTEDAGQATNMETDIPEALDVDKAFIKITANTINAASTSKLQKNGTDGNIAITITASTTGTFVDNTNTDSFIAGDDARWEITTGVDASQSLDMQAVGVRLTPDTAGNTISSFAGHNTGNTVLSSAGTLFVQFTGTRETSATESETQFQTRAALTLKRLYVQSGDNLSSDDTTFRTRVNGADGNQSVVFAASETGLKVDTSNTDAVSVDDLLNYSSISLTGVDFQIERIGVWGVSANDKFILPAYNQSQQVSNDGNNFFLPIAGEMYQRSTEAATDVLPEFNFTLSELICEVEVNNKTDPVGTTFYTRDNGANGNLFVRVSGFTGTFIDPENTDTITGGTDKINYFCDVKDPGSMELNYIAVVADPTGGGGGGTRDDDDPFDHDFQTDGGTFTTTSPHTFTHTPARLQPKGVVVQIIQNDSTDRITSVSYGGVAMTRQETAADTTGEPGRCYIYFLGSNVPEGDQTVSIAHDGNAVTKKVACYTISGMTDTEVVDSTILEGDQQNASMILDSGANDAVRYASLFSGLGNAANTSPAAGMTAFAVHDFGATHTRQNYQADPVSGSDECGFATNSVDDLAAASIAVQESAGVTLEQEGFRFRNDDGDEANATWRQSQDVNDTIDPNTNIRLRTLINASGDPASKQYQLEYRKVGDADWKKVE